MNAKQAKELVGKYGLFQVGDLVRDSHLNEVSPSGNYVRVGFEWVHVEKVSFLEELPEPTPLTPNAMATDVPEKAPTESTANEAGAPATVLPPAAEPNAPITFPTQP